MSVSQIQSQFTSVIKADKLANFEVEFTERPTMTLIHTTSRFLFFKRGKGKLSINGIEYNICPNAFITIMAWDITTITEVKEPLEFYKLAYNNSFVNAQLRTIYNPTSSQITIVSDIMNHPVAYLSGDLLRQAEYAFDLVQKEVNEKGINYDCQELDLTNSYVVSLIIQLLVIHNRCNKQDSDVVCNDTDMNLISDILRYIYSHVSSKITLEKLSSLFFMSESTIRRHFEKSLGYSFSELVNAMRVSKAIDLLMYTNFSLDLIAENVGFTDASHLTKVFSLDRNMTPKMFREMIQNSRNYLKHREQDISFKVLDYINDNSSDSNLSAYGVCQAFDISLKELNHITQFYVEKAFSDYLDWIRISKASELLLNSNYTITFIAIEVGYNSTKTFQRAFLKYRKSTPTDFKKTVHFQASNGEVRMKTGSV